eukprot:620332-Amorphochlora_amoeboformis.AAC.1
MEFFRDKKWDIDLNQNVLVFCNVMLRSANLLCNLKIAGMHFTSNKHHRLITWSVPLQWIETITYKLNSSEVISCSEVEKKDFLHMLDEAGLMIELEK